MFNLALAVQIFRSANLFKKRPFDQNRKVWGVFLLVGVVMTNPMATLKYLPWNPKHLKRWAGSKKRTGWMGLPRSWMLAIAVLSSSCDGVIKILLKSLYTFEINPVADWFVKYSLVLTGVACFNLLVGLLEAMMHCRPEPDDDDDDDDRASNATCASNVTATGEEQANDDGVPNPAENKYPTEITPV